MAWGENENSPFFVPAPEQDAARGALAPQESGGLTRFLGNVARGFNRVMSSPAYARLWSGMVSGMAGDPMAGPRALQQLREMQTPSIQDELARYRLRQMKREEDEDVQKNALRSDAFAKLQAGDTEGAKTLLAQLFPQLAAEQMFRAPPKPGVPKAVLDPATGKPKYVPSEEAIGQEPYYRPPITVNTGEGPKLTDVRGLRTDYGTEAARFRTAIEQLPMMRAAAQQATGAGDLGLVVAVAKIRDPNSVVREGEVELVREDRSRIEEIRLAAKRLKDSGILLPEQRKRLIASIEAEVKSLAPAEAQRRKNYEAIARQYGIDPTFIYGADSVDDLLRSAGIGGKSGAAPRGLLTPGNIDLYAQPVVQNADGSTSTVRSMSIGVNGREVLIPQVTPDGRNLTPEQAIAEFKKTGRHLGVFDTPENATAYARQLHEDYASGKYRAAPGVRGVRPHQ